MSNNGQSGGPEQPAQVQIDIDWSDEPMPVYANGAQMVHSHREFAIAFTEFAPFAGRQHDFATGHNTGRLVDDESGLAVPVRRGQRERIGADDRDPSSSRGN